MDHVGVQARQRAELGGDPGIRRRPIELMKQRRPHDEADLGLAAQQSADVLDGAVRRVRFRLVADLPQRRGELPRQREVCPAFRSARDAKLAHRSALELRPDDDDQPDHHDGHGDEWNPPAGVHADDLRGTSSHCAAHRTAPARHRKRSLSRREARPHDRAQVERTGSMGAGRVAERAGTRPSVTTVAVRRMPTPPTAAAIVLRGPRGVRRAPRGGRGGCGRFSTERTCLNLSRAHSLGKASSLSRRRTDRPARAAAEGVPTRGRMGSRPRRPARSWHKSWARARAKTTIRHAEGVAEAPLRLGTAVVAPLFARAVPL